MALDPEIAKIIDTLKGTPSMEEMSVKELRESMLVVPPHLRTPVQSVRNIKIPAGQHDIPARLYVPNSLSRHGLVVFYHGGGYVIGNLETHDHVCRDLASQIGSMVISIDYRLAPEHKYPAAVDDCFVSARWAFEHAKDLDIDPSKIVLAGDSAGATLAAVTALRLRDQGFELPLAQVLVYPVTDYHTPATPSYIENATGYVLTRAAMIRFWDEYLSDPVQASHPYTSPLKAASLKDLPQTLLLTAEFDPLRDEGVKYADRLRESGVVVTHWNFDGLIHGFFRMSLASKRAKESVTDTARWIASVME